VSEMMDSGYFEDVWTNLDRHSVLEKKDTTKKIDLHESDSDSDSDSDSSSIAKGKPNTTSLENIFRSQNSISNESISQSHLESESEVVVIDSGVSKEEEECDNIQYYDDGYDDKIESNSDLISNNESEATPTFDLVKLGTSAALAPEYDIMDNFDMFIDSNNTGVDGDDTDTGNGTDFACAIGYDDFYSNSDFNGDIIKLQTHEDSNGGSPGTSFANKLDPTYKVNSHVSIHRGGLTPKFATRNISTLTSSLIKAPEVSMNDVVAFMDHLGEIY